MLTAESLRSLAGGEAATFGATTVRPEVRRDAKLQREASPVLTSSSVTRSLELGLAKAATNDLERILRICFQTSYTEDPFPNIFGNGPSMFLNSGFPETFPELVPEKFVPHVFRKCFWNSFRKPSGR